MILATHFCEKQKIIFFMKRLLFFSVLSALLFAACNDTNNDKNNTYLPPSVGPINSVAVVIDNDLWEGTIGDTIRRYFAAPVDGLPTEEPTFTLHQIPPQVFEGNTRNSRNILIVQRGDEKKAFVKENHKIKIIVPYTHF